MRHLDLAPSIYTIYLSIVLIISSCLIHTILLFIHLLICTYSYVKSISSSVLQMLKRMSTGSREENYEHVLMCLICRSLFDDGVHQPKFLPCHHTFCKVRELFGGELWGGRIEPMECIEPYKTTLCIAILGESRNPNYLDLKNEA